jgi:hypothetical protein
MRILDAFNERDLAGTNAALHFPYVWIAGGEVRVFEHPESFPGDLFDRLIATGWHHTLWDYRRAVQSGKDKVHFAVQFTRYQADGSVIGSYPSMWIVTFKDGRWGVQASSSFAGWLGGAR